MICYSIVDFVQNSLTWHASCEHVLKAVQFILEFELQVEEFIQLMLFILTAKTYKD